MSCRALLAGDQDAFGVATRLLAQACGLREPRGGGVGRAAPPWGVQHRGPHGLPLRECGVEWRLGLHDGACATVRAQK